MLKILSQIHGSDHQDVSIISCKIAIRLNICCSLSIQQHTIYLPSMSLVFIHNVRVLLIDVRGVEGRLTEMLLKIPAVIFSVNDKCSLIKCQRNV